MAKVAAHVPLRKAASPQPVIKNKIHRPIPHRPHATLPGGKPKNPNIQRPEKMERPAIDMAVAATITPPSSSVPMAGKKPVTKEKPHEPAPSLGRDREPEAAGLILRAWATGNVLWIKRGKKGDHVGEWAFPGGGIEKGESPVVAAVRETREETGFINETQETPSHIATFNTGDVEFALYELKVNNEFIPTLNDESDAWAWAPLDDPPQPVHTGLKKSSVIEHAQDKQPADDVESTGPASPEKIEAIKRAVYQAANELGFPTDKIKIVNKSEPHDIATMFDPRGTKASYDFDTGEMVFYPPGLKSDRMEYILPIFRHELMHMKFEQFLKSLKANPELKKQYESIINDPYSLYVGARDVSNYADVSFERYRHGDSQLKDALHETLADMVKYDRKNTRSNPLNALYALVEESSKKMAKDAKFNENDHPRGQPGNPGQFTSGGGGGGSSKSAEWAKNMPKPTPSEAKALGAYIDSEGIYIDESEVDDINQKIRQEGVFNENAKALRALIARSSFPEDAVVFRGVHNVGNFANKLLNMPPGSFFHEKGFMSASSSSEMARQFTEGDGVVIEIFVQKGSKAFAVPSGGTHEEGEVLLQHGSDLRIRSIDKGKRVIKATLFQPRAGEDRAMRRHAKDAGFEEGKHPRDQGGQFTSGGGGSHGSSSAKPSKKKREHLKALELAKEDARARMKYLEGFNQKKEDRQEGDSAMDSDYEEVEHNGRLPRLEAHTFGSFIGPVIKPNRGSFKATPEMLYRGQFAGDTKLVWRKRIEAKLAMDKSRVGIIRAQVNGIVRLAMLALDESMRSYDFDGRLHVKLANISKATVNPYVGNEIPDFKKLGLDPNKIYYLYRDPEELEKGAATFNLLPLLSEHQPVTANTHDQKLVVGSTGTDANFEAPFLRNSLVIWPEADIKKIEKNDKRQISCGYRYTPDMTPGVSPAGERYDGVMRDIVGNHVALVSEGRAGKDVTIER